MAKEETIDTKIFIEMDFCQLNKFYRDHPHDDIPDWFDDWLTAIYDSHPFDQIFERVNAIEKTLDVILKKVGSEMAEISVRELIRLKGGHS